MKIFRDAAIGIFFLLLALVALRTYVAIPRLEALADQAGVELHAHSISTLRLEAALTATTYRIADDVEDLKGDWQKTSGALIGVVDDRLGETNGALGMAAAALDQRLAEANATLGRSNADLSFVTALAGQMEGQIITFIPQFESRYLAVTGELMRTLDAARKTSEVLEANAPALAAAAVQNGQNVQGITADVHQFTSRFTGKRSFKSKLWEFMKTAGYVFARAS